MAKYNQLESSKYENNEYSNMPSLDYYRSSYHIRPQNIKEGCDWDKVREICAKHGFSLQFIYPTFCMNSSVDACIYYKTDINEDEYTRLLYSDNREDNKKAWDIIDSFTDKYYALHDCLHELDEETNLYFNCGSAGNVGLFGSNDVRRRVYKFASGLTTYKNLCRSNDPDIHDTAKRFGKGVYVMASTSTFKIDESDIFPEFDNEMALKVMREYAPNLNFEVCMGRRACDGPDEYEAIVVTNKKGTQYGSFTFNKDGHDVVTMCYRAVLCGETSTILSRETYVEQIKDALRFMCS